LSWRENAPKILSDRPSSKTFFVRFETRIIFSVATDYLNEIDPSNAFFELAKSIPTPRGLNHGLRYRIITRRSPRSTDSRLAVDPPIAFTGLATTSHHQRTARRWTVQDLESLDRSRRPPGNIRSSTPQRQDTRCCR
jgi:hypothetical protein